MIKQMEQWLLLSAFVVVGGMLMMNWVKSAVEETAIGIAADILQADD